MINKELLTKVKRIELKTARLVTDAFAGQYHSIFKGQGIEFEEVREYQIGDDVRTIDWNVTAKNGRPFVKKFVEERELTVMVLVDASASMRFGTVNQFKNQLAAETASLLSLAAIRNQDKVGLMMFTDHVEKFIPVRKGVRHVLRIIREVLYHQPKGTGTDLVQALKTLNNVMTRRAIVFVVSDFLGVDAQDRNSSRFEELRKQLIVTNRNHDVILLALNDPRENEMPATSLIALKDLESGRLLNIDPSSGTFRDRYNKENLQRLSARAKAFQSIGIDMVDVWTHRPVADRLVQFFKERQKRRI